jgi:DNA-binding MarR family transcriptional regulator
MLSRTELDVWRSFLRAHAHITRVLEAELLAAQRLSLASYDVLVQLSAAPGRRLRMTELADAVLLSRSGVTRLVDRLERSGLVARARVDSDGRGVVAVLTQLGFDRLRDATGTHLSGVARHFAGPLEREEMAAFGQTCERLANADTNADIGADPNSDPTAEAEPSEHPADVPATENGTNPGTI